MAIHRTVRTAMKLITALDVDVQLTYKAERQMERLTARLRGTPTDYQIHDREIPQGDHNVPVRIFTPPGEGPFPMMLFFHGGGWVTGGIENYTGLCTELAKSTGHRVASVDYQLAPEYPFPAGPMDCYAVAKAFFTGHVEGVDPEQITLVGDSAGGNLAAVVSLMARDRGEFLPRQQILLYPATAADHTDTSPYPSVHENGQDYILTSHRVQRLMEMYASGPADWQNPYFAPLLAENLSNQPRTLVVTAEFCPLRDEGEAYAERLREAGNDAAFYRVKDAIHAYMMMPPQLPQVRETYGVINHFLSGRYADEQGQ